MNFKKVSDDYVLKPRFNVSRVYKYDKPIHVILYYEGDGKHFTVIVLDGQIEPPVFDEGKIGHYSWQKRCSLAFAKGRSCLHFPSQVCNNLPFAEDHKIKVVNLETNYTAVCTVQESDTLYPQYHLTKPWYSFVKNMQLKENDELCFLLDHPPTKLIVWKI
ncbi:hypothetical protein QL285_049721 [Trifolium repens]|nr:hypothetical protein QL285_049721 [Trifolium repens]